jgi:hypothetical protein
MSSLYIDVPLDTNPESIYEDMVAFLQAAFPGWEPSQAQLDNIILRLAAIEGAENRDVASRVPTSIFRYFGATLMSFPPLDATRSTVASTWVMKNNAGYFVPAGTQVTIRDTVGNEIPFETLTSITVPSGSTSTAAGAVTLVSVNPGVDTSGLGGVGIQAKLQDILDFVQTITLTGLTTGGQDAETDSTYLDRLARRLSRLSLRPILPIDFANMALEADPAVARAVAIDGYNPQYNALTANEASAETDASGWANFQNTSVGSSSAQAADGTKSVSLTSGGTSPMEAATPATGATGKPASPGEIWTGVVSVRAFSTVRSVRAFLAFYDAANALIGSVTYGTAANDSNSAWTEYKVTGVAPNGTTKVRVGVSVASPVSTELHYADKAALRRGTYDTYTPGGTPETGNARTIAVAGHDAAGNALSAPVKGAIDALLQANREVNFLVYVMDPTYSNLDVTYNVQALSGFDIVDLKARIDAAIAQYANPLTWGAPTGTTEWRETNIVRYFEVIQQINNVDGVDYINSVTIGINGGTQVSTNITIAGPASLVRTGTLVGTVVAG